jgi:Ser/Thr protein kinase RdoA (MazF antagonist)
VEVNPLGNGRINDTFLVLRDAVEEPRFVLQRLNGRVFRHPEGVMGNLRKVTDHGRRRLGELLDGRPDRFELPRLLPALDGRDHWVDAQGSTWRAFSFIEDARSLDAVRHAEHAWEVGRALGLFHAAMSDLPEGALVDTLPGFHITPAVLRRYDEVRAGARPPASSDLEYCYRLVSRGRVRAGVLEDARTRGLIRMRTIHGDPKAANVMIDTATRRAVGIVDLDTVKPGLVHYDIGDCLRSCCNPGGEAAEAETVRFDLDLCRAALRGYFEWAGRLLTPIDSDYIHDAARLIAFELGVRFLTDHLEGNVYFKVSCPGQNLNRAMVQLKLVESIEEQESAIRAVVGELA